MAIIFQTQIAKCLKDANKINLNTLNDYSSLAKHKVEDFLECAKFWEQAGDLFKKASDEQVRTDNHSWIGMLGNDFSFSLAYASSCYFNAGKALQLANSLKKASEKNYTWNEKDDKALKLFKQALWADKGIEIEEFHVENRAAFKERSLNVLYSIENLQTLKRDEKVKETTAKLFRKELKLVGIYELVTGEMTWRAKMKQARHLMQAALIAPNTEKKQKLLLQAEKIAQDIWYNCPSCTNYPEFSPNYHNNPEYTLLGEIQILLGHCKFTPGFILVSVDC